MAPRAGQIFLALLLLLGSSGGLSAYGGDTHYYLRFASALETCFDWDEAHLIASADYMVDKNRATTSEKDPFKRANKINWHAFGHSEERFNELWERVVDETDPELQLVKLGQFLHFATDWESHYGYGTRMGHGLPTVFGRDPDSLANDRMNNLRMIGQTLDHMVQVCVMQERKTEWKGDSDRFLAQLLEDLDHEPLLEELYAFNSRKWKTFAVRGKKGKAILAKNHLLIEQLIERRSREHPERNVPADFTPGDAERGLPPPIGLRYDQSGEVLEVYGVEIELMPEFDGTRMSAAEEESFEERVETELVDDLEEQVQDGEDLDLFSNVELEVVDADLEANGWRVEAIVENLGQGASKSGALDIFVIHVASEEMLGKASQSVPKLAGGESMRLSLLVPATGKPERDILIGASLKVLDLSAQGNDVWYVPWKDAIKGEEGKRKRKKPRQPGTVGLLGAPKMWVDADGDFWLLLRAVVSGGDSSRRLGDVRLELLDAAGGTVYEFRSERVVWISAADFKRRVVPAESFHTVPSREEFCAALSGPSPSVPDRLEITISGGNAEPISETYPLGEQLIDRARGFCTTGN